MMNLNQRATDSSGVIFTSVVGLWISVSLLGCSTSELPADSPEIGDVSVATEAAVGEQATELTASSSMEDVESDNVVEVVASAGAPQFHEPILPDLDCGESCGFWMGEHYIIIETSECEPVDPRVGATIPFEPDKIHEIRLGDLHLASEIDSSGN